MLIPSLLPGEFFSRASGSLGHGCPKPDAGAACHWRLRGLGAYPPPPIVRLRTGPGTNQGNRSGYGRDSSHRIWPPDAARPRQLAGKRFRDARAHLDPAREVPRRHLHQVDRHGRDFGGIQLPVRVLASRTETGLDAPGHDRADADVRVAQIQHDSFAESRQAELGGVVGRALCERVLARQAPDIQHESAASPLHAGSRQPGAVERPAQVGVDDLAPIVRTHFIDGSEAPDARVVNQHVHAPEFAVDELEEGLDLLPAAHVAGPAHDASGGLEFFHRLRHAGSGPAADRDRDSLREQGFRDRASNAARAACHDCGLAFNLMHGFSSGVRFRPFGPPNGAGEGTRASSIQ